MKKDNVIRFEKNYIKKMDIFYVAICKDKGQEGMLAFLDTERMIPVIKGMCGGTEADFQHIKKFCQEAANSSGCEVQILRFSRREIIEVYQPKKGKSDERKTH